MAIFNLLIVVHILYTILNCKIKENLLKRLRVWRINSIVHDFFLVKNKIICQDENTSYFKIYYNENTIITSY